MQNLQKDWLQRLGAAPFGTEVLKAELSGFSRPIQKAHLLVSDGTLLRLKRGLFCISPEASGRPVDARLVANALHGPSYVSFETVLASRGLIPERVAETISAVTGRSRSYETPVGRFVYRTVPSATFAIGVRSIDGALVACPEKALCDYLETRPNLRLSSPRSLRAYLEDEVRFDFDVFGAPDVRIFADYAAMGRKKPLFAALERIFS